MPFYVRVPSLITPVHCITQTEEPNKLDIKSWNKQRDKLLENPETQKAWLEYCSGYPHVSAYFKKSEQYRNQNSVINGKSASRKINLYCLFTEQCFNLLHPQGYCGIIIPSGIYTDLGSKQLREMLFSHCQLGTLFGLSNERFIFEGVDHRFKFCLFDFAKGKNTEVFNAVFRINPREAISKDKLEIFLYNKDEQVQIYTNLIRKLSPDSLSVMEFKQDIDIHIAEKMSHFPLLGETLPDTWNLKLTQELHMTNDSYLFKQVPTHNCVPLIQGNMFHQFNNNLAAPKYWIDLDEGRKKILGKQEDKGQKLSYQDYRLVHRRIARNTDQRSLIACILPKNRFCADTAQTVKNILPYKVTIYIATLFNSFVNDYQIRQRITAHCDIHFMCSLKIPRLKERDKYFQEIVENAAKLICTTEEFEQLAKEVGIGCQ